MANTSMPAPATRPERTASASASSSTMPPRAVLTIRSPGLAVARSSLPISPSVSGVLGRWTVTKSDLRHQLLEGGQRHAHLAGPLGGYVRVVGAQPHPEGVRPLGHQRPDPPEPDDAEGLAVELDSLPPGSLPLPGDERGVGLGEVAGLGEQEGHGVLGGRQDVGLRGVHHHHPPSGGGGHIDVVDADTRPSHDHEVGAGREHAGVDGGGGADDEGVGADHRLLGARRATSRCERRPRARPTAGSRCPPRRRAR